MPKAGRNLELKIDIQPAAVKQNAAACHTGRPRIGVRRATPDNRSRSLFYDKERKNGRETAVRWDRSWETDVYPGGDREKRESNPQ
jgi:hypothetical protein